MKKLILFCSTLIVVGLSSGIAQNTRTKETDFRSAPRNADVSLRQILPTNDTPEIEWQKNLGGTEDDEAYSVQSTSDGGFIVAGHTHSENMDVTQNHGMADMWVLKLSAGGDVEWQNCYGGTKSDFARDIEQTSDHGYVILGYTASKDGDVTGSYGGQDVWLVKIDSSGNLIWQKNFGGSLNDKASDIDITDDGGYIIAAFSQSDDFDLTDNKGGNDYWIIKLDSNAQIEWQRSLGGTGEDIASEVEIDADGNVVVNGSSRSMDGDVTGNHSGKRDYWVVKLNKDGEMLWEKCYGGSGHENGNDLVLSADNGILLAGNVQSNDGDVIGVHDALDDYWFVMLDEVGNILWQKCIGGTGDDCAEAVANTSDHGFIATGHTFSKDDGDVTGHDGGADYWQVKLDSAGNIQWQLCIGGTNNTGTLGDYPFDIVQATDGGYVVVGRSDSYDNDLTGNNGKYDIWVVKLTCDAPATPTITPLGNLDICETGFVILKASSGNNYTYQWYRNHVDIAGAINQIFKAKKSDNYRVRISTGPGCHAVSEKTVVYSSCKLAEEDEFISTLNLYPNPTAGTFTLNLKLTDEENSQAIIQVLNTLGQVVYDETTLVSNGVLQKEIQLNDAAADGMYLVKVIINDQVFSSQINYQK